MTPKNVCFFVVGGGLPVAQKQPSAQKKPLRQQDKMAHNPLDSTSPLVKKGKQREVPKLKKPTALKKASGPSCVYVFVFSGRMLIVFFLSLHLQVILKEREERKQRRLLEERGLLPEQDFQPGTDATEDQQSNVTDATGEKQHLECFHRFRSPQGFAAWTLFHLPLMPQISSR